MIFKITLPQTDNHLQHQSRVLWYWVHRWYLVWHPFSLMKISSPRSSHLPRWLWWLMTMMTVMTSMMLRKSTATVMMMVCAFFLACQSRSRSGDHLNVWNGLFDCFLKPITIFLGAIPTMTVRRWWQYWSQSDKPDFEENRGSNSDLNSNCQMSGSSSPW